MIVRAPSGLKIVVTGASSSGKSRLVSSLSSSLPWPLPLVIIPEVATDLISSRGIDQARLDADARSALQLEIYKEQIRREAAAPRRNHLIVLDRGTVDGAAYWPDGAARFWSAIGSSLAAELARYDAVIWLESAAGQ